MCQTAHSLRKSVSSSDSLAWVSACKRSHYVCWQVNVTVHTDATRCSGHQVFWSTVTTAINSHYIKKPLNTENMKCYLCQDTRARMLTKFYPWLYSPHMSHHTSHFSFQIDTEWMNTKCNIMAPHVETHHINYNVTVPGIMCLQRKPVNHTTLNKN